MSAILFYVGFVLVLLLLLLDHLHARRRLARCRLPPGPARVPVLGFLHRLDPEAPYLTLTAMVKKYGKVSEKKNTFFHWAFLRLSGVFVLGFQHLDGFHSLRCDH